MKKIKIKVKILNYILVLFFLLSNSIYSNADYDNYNSHSYYIKNMDVNVDVNDKREFVITETIDIHYNEPRHGIIRNIPLASSLENYKITDISVQGDMYNISEDSTAVNIKIGNPDYKVAEDKRYVIKYTLKHYSDETESGDYLYLNVLGNEWDVPVVNFTSNINYPNDFVLNSINLTSGEYGSRTNEFADYVINENSVTIHSKKTVPSFNAITVNIEFEEGAFLNAPLISDSLTVNKLYVGYLVNILNYTLLIVAIVFVFASKTKIDKITKVVEFYPPENMNSVDVGYIYSGIVTSKMITSYIYDWASKGYIRIDMSDEENITLVRLRPLKADDEFERDLFKEMFYWGTKGRVTESQLKYRLHPEFKKVKKKMKSKYKKNKKYSKKSSFASIVIKNLSIVLMVITVSYESYIEIYAVREGFIMLLPVCLFILLLINDSVSEIYYDFNKSFIKNIKDSYKIFTLIGWYLFFCVITHIMNVNDYSVVKHMSLALPSFVSFALSLMIVNNKSDYEKEIYGRICGFKDFIERAEKDRLEILISEDPDYFYNILPYAQALGITSVWADKFKDIAIEPSTHYGHSITPSKINSMSESLEKAMENAGASKNGSHGGGGFSGGGSGGGGGSSW